VAAVNNEQAGSAGGNVLSIPAIAFVGKQNSGKTTLLVQVVAELTRRGVRVGTVKHHSHFGFDFDHEGKDSWRHAQAGSRYTVVSAPDKLGSVRLLSEELPVESIIAQMSANTSYINSSGVLASELNIILVEGYRKSSLPTIELFRAANPNDVSRELGGEGNDIVAVVTDMERIINTAEILGIACFEFNDIKKIADFVLAQLVASR
jgi:molybdopterin-guanine dinucleotide biosynthesis protein MobB